MAAAIAAIELVNKQWNTSSFRYGFLFVARGGRCVCGTRQRDPYNSFQWVTVTLGDDWSTSASAIGMQ